MRRFQLLLGSTKVAKRVKNMAALNHCHVSILVGEMETEREREREKRQGEMDENQL